MKQYIGRKEINAEPMNRLEYNQFRGWELPKDENGTDEGYLVEYIDGGQANTKEYKGYVSWSPKDVFERAYKVSDTFEDRLVIERDELKEKLDKLTDFVAKQKKELTIKPVELYMLAKQLHYMDDYFNVLNNRLELLNK